MAKGWLSGCPGPRSSGPSMVSSSPWVTVRSRIESPLPTNSNSTSQPDLQLILMCMKVWQSPVQRKLWQNGWISKYTCDRCLWTMLNNPELCTTQTALCARDTLLTNKPQKMPPLISCRITPKESLAGAFQDYLSFRNPLTQVAPPSSPPLFTLTAFPPCGPRAGHWLACPVSIPIKTPKKMELEKVPAVSIGFSVTPLLDIVVLANDSGL